MNNRDTNILLTAVGRRAYLVEYFKEVLKGTGGKVYAANSVRDTTGLMAADAFEIVVVEHDHLAVLRHLYVQLHAVAGGGGELKGLQ